MLKTAMVTFLLMSVPAAADEMEHKVVAALTGDEIGDGPVIELDIFGVTSGLSGTSFSFLGNTNTTPLVVVPSVMVGWEWDQMAALIGAQFISTAGTNGQNGPVTIAIPVTFRRYLKPLQVYAFSPFIEGSVDLEFVVPAGQGLNLGFGVNGGFGGEYVFARNFGLFGKALLGFQYIPTAINQQTTNSVGIGIGGVMGVLIHF